MSIYESSTEVGLPSLEGIATKIQEHTAQAEAHCIKIGKLLNQAYAQIEHGGG